MKGEFREGREGGREEWREQAEREGQEGRRVKEGEAKQGDAHHKQTKTDNYSIISCL